MNNISGSSRADAKRMAGRLTRAGALGGCLLFATFGTGNTAEYNAPSHHARVEQLARNTAYLGGNTSSGPRMAKDPELLNNLKQRGLKLEDFVDDSKTGAQAMVVRDTKSRDTYILFRGTWPKGLNPTSDVSADADRFGDTGSSQYEKNKATFDRWAQEYPNSIVTGHSLGAALGQRFTADNPNKVREGIFFNAPAIDKVHAERFARAEKQPPVTTYVGGSVIPSDAHIPVVAGRIATTIAPPSFDIVSEFGGRSHLPGRIVESLNLKPPDSFLGIMGANHTDYMLSGKGQRKTEEVPYERYQERREDNWRNSEGLFQGMRTAMQLGDAATGTLSDLADILIPNARQGAAAVGRAAISEETRAQLGTLGQSIAGMLQGYGKTGPSGPSPRMVTSAGRDCKVAEQSAQRALTGVQGAITAASIEDAKLRVRIAQDRSTGCPGALAKIATAQGVIAAAGGRLVERTRHTLNSCEPAKIELAAREVGGMVSQADAISLAAELRRRLAELSEIRGKIDSARDAFHRAREAGNLRAMQAQATAVRNISSLGKLSVCFKDDFQRAVNSLASIDSLIGVQDRANALLESCAVDKVRPLVTKLQGLSPVHRAVAQQLSSRIQTCEGNRERLQARCLQAYGNGYTLSEVSADGKQFWCRPSQDVANRKCVEKNGIGYLARNITDRGQYTCYPTQAAANRRCNELNPGNGWVAQNLKPDGTYQCFLPGHVRLANANAECRLKYRHLFSHVEFRGRTTICHHCQPGTYPRNRRCVTPGQRVPVVQRVPGGGNRGGAQYICVIHHPDGSLLGGGGSKATIRTSAPIRGANCRRIR